MNSDLMLNFLLAMVAIVNPIGLIPIWYELTGDAQPKVRRRIAVMVVGTAFVILLVFVNVGIFILQFFAIDIEVFKIAGGLLLMLTAVSMVEGKASRLTGNQEEGQTDTELAARRFEKVLVPLTIPMLAGPGSLTTVLLYSAQSQELLDYLGKSLVLVVSYAFLFLVLIHSYLLEEKVNKLAFVAFTRIFGVIVAAIAIQFVVEGLGAVFPNWLEGGSAVE
ncbi:MarC family protein [Cyclobacterium xiamenense]|uniref:MarC family protein n=1 Tax=Cyclobacterium xiamenense TaxID=1297121 RepID=UPI0012B7D170|nr:MarC family protein [Cyclobacterium xiamenense]